jgi:acyl-CoA thioesterase FadM
VRGARFRYEYAVERGGETIADGWTSHATVDARTFAPTRVPEFLSAAIAAAESSSSTP